AVANLAEKQNIKMAFPQFSGLWKLIDLLVRKDFRQANLAKFKILFCLLILFRCFFLIMY
ncbi:MAG: hypothetical protein WCO84_10110, partial [bacterium]